MKTLDDFFWLIWWIGTIAILFLDWIIPVSFFDFLVLWGAWSLIVASVGGLTTIARDIFLR